MKSALSLALLTAGTAHAGPGLVFTIELDTPSVVLYKPVTVHPTEIAVASEVSA